MDDIAARLSGRKRELDELKREAAGDALEGLEGTRDLELTFTSNAIEGNTLTATETALVIERGITVAGKPLKDHLEAVDHHEALGYVRELARRNAPPSEYDIRSLHRLVVMRSRPDIAGSYADRGRFVLTDAGRHAFPTPLEVPGLMHDLGRWLAAAAATPDTAFQAHRRLVDIHPFNDGNGRVARLLMNLLLIRGDWPPVPVRPEDRARYLATLQLAQATGDAAPFERLLWERLEVEVDASLAAIREHLAITGRRTR